MLLKLHEEQRLFFQFALSSIERMNFRSLVETSEALKNSHSNLAELNKGEQFYRSIFKLVEDQI